MMMMMMIGLSPSEHFTGGGETSLNGEVSIIIITMMIVMILRKSSIYAVHAMLCYVDEHYLIAAVDNVWVQ